MCRMGISPLYNCLLHFFSCLTSVCNHWFISVSCNNVSCVLTWLENLLWNEVNFLSSFLGNSFTLNFKQISDIKRPNHLKIMHLEIADWWAYAYLILFLKDPNISLETRFLSGGTKILKDRWMRYQKKENWRALTECFYVSKNYFNI